jgi:hypothetical protein
LNGLNRDMHPPPDFGQLPPDLGRAGLTFATITK